MFSTALAGLLLLVANIDVVDYIDLGPIENGGSLFGSRQVVEDGNHLQIKLMFVEGFKPTIIHYAVDCEMGLLKSSLIDFDDGTSMAIPFSDWTESDALISVYCDTSHYER